MRPVRKGAWEPSRARPDADSLLAALAHRVSRLDGAEVWQVELMRVQVRSRAGRSRQTHLDFALLLGVVGARPWGSVQFGFLAVRLLRVAEASTA